MVVKEIGRYCVYAPLELVAKIGGKIGVAGVAVGDGSDYIGKLGDGFSAVPDIVGYCPKLCGDAESLQKAYGGIEKMTDASGAKALMENTSAGLGDYLSHFFSKAGEVTKGGSDLYEVVTDIDYNGLWVAGGNFLNNIVDQPMETGVAMAAMMFTASRVSSALRAIRTKGGGTFFEQKVWYNVPDRIKQIV